MEINANFSAYSDHEFKPLSTKKGKVLNIAGKLGGELTTFEGIPDERYAYNLFWLQREQQMIMNHSK